MALIYIPALLVCAFQLVAPVSAVQLSSQSARTKRSAADRAARPSRGDVAMDQHNAKHQVTGGSLEEIAQPTPVNSSRNFLQYLPEHNTVVCTCAKCGSTSAFQYIYEAIFNRSWPYEGPPFIYAIQSERWENRWDIVLSEKLQDQIMANASYKLAIIREPKERIISAWKSKVACADEYDPDIKKRQQYVDELLSLVGNHNKKGRSCLSFAEFLNILAKVHRSGKSYLLNPHFLPQNLGCFYRTTLDQWDKVVTIGEPGALNELAATLGAIPREVPASNPGNGTLKIDRAIDQLLTEITKNEYELFGDKLPA